MAKWITFKRDDGCYIFTAVDKITDVYVDVVNGTYADVVDGTKTMYAIFIEVQGDPVRRTITKEFKNFLMLNSVCESIMYEIVNEAGENFIDVDCIVGMNLVNE